MMNRKIRFPVPAGIQQNIMLLFLASFTRIAGPIKDSQNNSRADPSLMVDRGRARVINWSGQETEKARHLLIMIIRAQMMFRDLETYLRLLCCPPTSLHLQSISAPDSHRSDLTTGSLLVTLS